MLAACVLQIGVCCASDCLLLLALVQSFDPVCCCWTCASSPVHKSWLLLCESCWCNAGNTVTCLPVMTARRVLPLSNGCIAAQLALNSLVSSRFLTLNLMASPLQCLWKYARTQRPQQQLARWPAQYASCSTFCKALDQFVRRCLLIHCGRRKLAQVRNIAKALPIEGHMHLFSLFILLSS